MLAAGTSPPLAGVAAAQDDSFTDESLAGHPDAADRDAIQQLLDRRAQAFLERDRDAFLGTIDPRAGGYRRRQARSFVNARAVPFSTYRLTADWSRYGDLARPREVALNAGAEDVTIPLTQERYGIRGFDQDEAVEDLFLTFVRRDGRWFVANDRDLEDVGLASVRHPWDFVPVRVARSDSFFGFGPPCPGDDPECSIQDLLPLAEQALERVEQVWRVPWSGRVVLIVPPPGGALKRMLQATFDPGKFVAFAYSTIDPDDLGYGGNRIIVNPGVISGRPRDQVLTIMAHELLHVATRAVSGPFVPLFVDEGLAEVVGYQGREDALSYLDSVVAAGAFDGKLPEDFRFSTGSSNDIFLSYQEAQSAVAYFVERWGIERFTRFYRRLGRVRAAPGLASWHVGRAFRRTTGMTLREFEQAWASSIRR